MPEPVNRFDKPGGGKFYRHPVTNEVFDSVTSILDLWDKNRLLQWATGLSAELALDVVPMLLRAGMIPDCGNTHNRCYQKHGRENRCERCPCGDCSQCWQRRIQWRHSAESSRRAQEGTECHEAINHWVVSGGDVLSLRSEVEPYFKTFLRWVADYGLTPNDGQGRFGNGSWAQSEATLLNREYGYAGTSDAAVWIHADRTPLAAALVKKLRDRGALGPVDHALIRIDYKTREKPNESLYNDMPLQGEAYERCTHLLLPDGQELEAPKTAARFILQLRPESYTFKPMRSGERVFNVFLGLLDAYRWAQTEGGKLAFDETMPWLNPAPFQEQPVVQALAAPDTSNPHGTTPSLLDPPPKTPARTAKKATKSATADTDPFALAQTARPTDRGSLVAAMKRTGGDSAWPAGQPDLSRFDDNIPF